MEYRSLLVSMMLVLSVPSAALADNPLRARAICLSAALQADAVPSAKKKTFCDDVTSEGQAECLAGALLSEDLDQNLGKGKEKDFCKDVKTRAEGVCIAGALQSTSVKFGHEKEYCAGVNEAQAICLSAALQMEGVQLGHEKSYCAEFANAGDPEKFCEAKIDDLKNVFSDKVASTAEKQVQDALQILNRMADSPSAQIGN